MLIIGLIPGTFCNYSSDRTSRFTEGHVNEDVQIWGAEVKGYLLSEQWEQQQWLQLYSWLPV